MPAPVMTLFLGGSTATTGTQVSSGNPLSLGLQAKGVASTPVTVDLWNDRGGGTGSDTATSVTLSSVNGVDDASAIFNGTAGNGFQSMLEARSVGASGVSGDYQTVWSPLGPAASLSMGNIPSNAKRIIEVRLNIPQDAPDIDLKTFTLRVQNA